MLVEPDYVWLGLDHFVEDISTMPGGFARWERATETTDLYTFEFVITSIKRVGELLKLETPGGYALFHQDGRWNVFAVDKNKKGVLTARRIRRFPPPPGSQ